MKQHPVRVTVEGPPNSGKTMIMALIHKALKEAGFADFEIQGLEDEPDGNTEPHLEKSLEYFKELPKTFEARDGTIKPMTGKVILRSKHARLEFDPSTFMSTQKIIWSP